jgi:hypothetical protein
VRTSARQKGNARNGHLALGENKFVRPDDTWREYSKMSQKMDKPIPLITISGDKFVVNEESMKVLANIKGEIAVVSVAGVYRFAYNCPKKSINRCGADDFIFCSSQNWKVVRSQSAAWPSEGVRCRSYH